MGNVMVIPAKRQVGNTARQQDAKPKSWYADEWSRQAPMAKSAPTAATTALRRLPFAANAVRCSAEFTGTIVAANPSSGAASVDWSQPDRNATQEPSMRRY